MSSKLRTTPRRERSHRELDIAGAKALKQRLGSKGADVAPPASVDVPEDAPPVYQWLGVKRPAPENPSSDAEDDAGAQGASMFRRLGLSFR
jgi:hypothetical protein